jgi:peptidoglycan/xylan/chitin deacetylase (PgdA/CDA1 family)
MERKMIYISRKKACITLMLAFALLLAGVSAKSLNLAQAVSGASAGQFPLPIIMYHSVMTETGKLGEYVLHASELEKDLKFLKAEGYETIFLSDLVEYQLHPEDGFPYEKPILLVFDDGFYNNYSVAFPLFKKYGMKFSLSVVAAYADTERERTERQVEYYSYCTWEQLEEMQKSGYVQLLNHTNDLHSIGSRMGVLQKKSEGDSDYSSVFESDVAYAQKRLEEIGMPYRFFAYPFGYYSKKTEELLTEMGFESTLTCAEGINYITPISSLKVLKRYNRIHGVPTEQFFKRVFSHIKS